MFGYCTEERVANLSLVSLGFLLEASGGEWFFASK